MLSKIAISGLLSALLATGAQAACELHVKLAEGQKVQSATAMATQLKLGIKGEASGPEVTFKDLLPDTAYDVQITLADGTVLQGVDMSWYGPEPAKPDAQALDEDDRQQIKELFEGVKAFENKRNLLAMAGNHDRVTILAELIRDDAFYGRKGDEVIWRVELWYFKNQHGGWEKVQQQNKVLRRVRFTGAAEYQRETSKLKWVAELGGIKVGKEQSRTVELPERK